MKIAQLIPQFYPHIGGAEICIHNVCSKLVEQGHEAIVITSTPAPEKKPGLPYKIEYLWEKTGGLFRNLPHFIGAAYLRYSLAELQKKYKFDLWQITNGYPLGIYAVDYFRKNKIPSVLRCCGDDIQKFPEINYGIRLKKEIDGLVTKKYPLFDGFVALTPSVRDEYLRLGIPDSKIKIIPNGVNLAKFAGISSEKKKQIRSDLGIKDDRILILTVGRYHPKKGFDLIPGIAKKLKENGLDFQWLIVGRNCCEIRKNHPESESLGISFVEKFANSAGNDAFSLPSKELIELYLSSDIFAFPTLIETFGMVLVEAMAAGLPIITTDAEGVRDVIEDGFTGIKVSAGDSVQFAEKLAVLVKNKDLRRELSSNAVKKSKEYDWNEITGQYMELYGNTAKFKENGGK